jgi:hypothetical protein
MACLVGSYLLFLIEHCDLDTWVPSEQLQSHSKTDDSSSYNGNVIMPIISRVQLTFSMRLR